MGFAAAVFASATAVATPAFAQAVVAAPAFAPSALQRGKPAVDGLLPRPHVTLIIPTAPGGINDGGAIS